MKGMRRGSVYRNTRGQWVAEVTLNRKRYTRKGRTAEEANAKLSRILADFHDGTLIADDKTRVAGFLLDWVKRIDVRPTTRRDYSTIITSHVNPHVGTKKLNALGPRDVELLIEKAREGKLSGRRQAMIRTVVKMALSSAQRWELVRRNVAALVKAPTKKVSRVECFDEAQFRTFLAVRGHRWEALFILAITLGPRKGEILGLKWSDIDGDTLHIRRTLQRYGGALVEFEPKNETSKRDLHMPKAVSEALRQWRIAQRTECLAAGVPFDVHGYVFTIDGRNLTRVYEKLLAGAGLPRRRFHDLRHTAATLMLMRGVPIKTVSYILGHSSIATTLDIYGHVFDSMKRDAAAIMDELIGG